MNQVCEKLIFDHQTGESRVCGRPATHTLTRTYRWEVIEGSPRCAECVADYVRRNPNHDTVVHEKI